MNNIAVIPARGGSKRIPFKNIKDFNGAPLISYSIKAALDSGVFSKVIVSIDDKKIIEVATQYGACAPFVRDKSLADDFTGTYDVVVDAYKRLKQSGENIDNVCCIYATAPLLNGFHLKRAYQKFIEDPKGNIVYREPQFAMTRSQDLQPCYQDCGQFYFYTAQNLEGKVANLKRIGYAMPRYRVIDIDTLDDFVYAQAISKALEELNLE